MRLDGAMCFAARALIATTASVWGIECDEDCLKTIGGSCSHEL